MEDSQVVGDASLLETPREEGAVAETEAFVRGMDGETPQIEGGESGTGEYHLGLLS